MAGGVGRGGHVADRVVRGGRPVALRIDHLGDRSVAVVGVGRRVDRRVAAGHVAERSHGRGHAAGRVVRRGRLAAHGVRLADEVAERVVAVGGLRAGRVDDRSDLAGVRLVALDVHRRLGRCAERDHRLQREPVIVVRNGPHDARGIRHRGLVVQRVVGRARRPAEGIGHRRDVAGRVGDVGPHLSVRVGHRRHGEMRVVGERRRCRAGTSRAVGHRDQRATVVGEDAVVVVAIGDGRRQVGERAGVREGEVVAGRIDLADDSSRIVVGGRRGVSGRVGERRHPVPRVVAVRGHRARDVGDPHEVASIAVPVRNLPSGRVGDGGDPARRISGEGHDATARVGDRRERAARVVADRRLVARAIGHRDQSTERVERRCGAVGERELPSTRGAVGQRRGDPRGRGVAGRRVLEGHRRA